MLDAKHPAFYYTGLPSGCQSYRPTISPNFLPFTLNTFPQLWYHTNVLRTSVFTSQQQA